MVNPELERLVNERKRKGIGITCMAKVILGELVKEETYTKIDEYTGCGRDKRDYKAHDIFVKDVKCSETPLHHMSIGMGSGSPAYRITARITHRRPAKLKRGALLIKESQIKDSFSEEPRVVRNFHRITIHYRQGIFRKSSPVFESVHLHPFPLVVNGEVSLSPWGDNLDCTKIYIPGSWEDEFNRLHEEATAVRINRKKKF